MINFLAYHDGTEPFKSMGKDLQGSVCNTEAGKCHVFEVEPNGGFYLTEFWGVLYPIISQLMQEGPVVVLDVDCLVRKKFDRLFEEDFLIGAIYRGKCANTVGKHDFLGCTIMLNDTDPQLLRYLILSWMANSLIYCEKDPDRTAQHRIKSLVARGWGPRWYAGQAAYNEMLFKAEDDGIRIKRLDRNEYAAHPSKQDAYITHRKGERKLL